MVAQVGALRVAIGADIRGLQTGMVRAQREVSKGATAMQRSVKSVNTSLAGLGTVAGVSLGAAGLLGGAQAFLKVADAAKSLQSQLKLATAEYGSLAQANKDVRVLAETTRSDLLATAELYAALQRNSGQLGTTQEQTARATQTVAEAFKISGAATSEQSAATRQLIQAFQSGVLRGDEFNSIMENAPRLAKLLADSLGVTTGALRKMAEEGELTADKLVRAFTDKKFTEGLDNEFKQLPVTFDEAMGQVYNAAIVVFSAFDRGGQFSTSIANFVSDGTDGFAQLEERAFSFGVQVSDTITAIDQVRLALGGLKTDGVGSFFGLIDATYSWRDALADTLGILDGVANAFANLANAPGNLLRSVSGYDPIVNPVDMRGGFLRTTNKKDLAAGYQRINSKSVADILADAGVEPKRPPAYRPPPAKPKKGSKGRTAKPPRDKSEDVSFQFEQELRQAQMDVLRAQQALAVTSEDRSRIALQLLTADRASQEAELNERVRRAERDFAEKKITAGALEQVKVQAEQLRLEYDKTNALEVQKVNEELLAEQARDRFDLADSSKDIEIEKLQLEAQLKTTAQERRDVELRILAAMKEQERARLDAVIADKQSSDLAKKQAAQRLAELDTIYAGREAGVVASTRGPMEDYLASLPDTAAKAQEALEHLQVQGIEGLLDATLKLSEGLDSAKDALLQTLKDFLLGLARMEMQKGVASLFGQSGGIGGFVSSIFGGGSSGSSIPTIALDAFGTGNNVPRFAGGGGFNVLGRKGIDNNMLSLNGLPIAKVSYGERVNISNDNNDRPGGTVRGGDTYMNIYTDDADSFRRSERQIARQWQRRVSRT